MTSPIEEALRDFRLNTLILEDRFRDGEVVRESYTRQYDYLLSKYLRDVETLIDKKALEASYMGEKRALNALPITGIIDSKGKRLDIVKADDVWAALNIIDAIERLKGDSL